MPLSGYTQRGIFVQEKTQEIISILELVVHENVYLGKFVKKNITRQQEAY